MPIRYIWAYAIGIGREKKRTGEEEVDARALKFLVTIYTAWACTQLMGAAETCDRVAVNERKRRAYIATRRAPSPCLPESISRQRSMSGSTEPRYIRETIEFC